MITPAMLPDAPDTATPAPSRPSMVACNWCSHRELIQHADLCFCQARKDYQWRRIWRDCPDYRPDPVRAGRRVP